MTGVERLTAALPPAVRDAVRRVCWSHAEGCGCASCAGAEAEDGVLARARALLAEGAE